MNKIKDIIQSSINVKQQVLQSEELIDTIEKVVNVIATALEMASMYIFVATVEVQQTRNIWQQNFLVAFMLTGKPCLQRPFIVTLLI